MFDFSALDAELDSLGRAPENTKSLAQAFAGITLSSSLAAQLEQIDAELSALSDGAYQAPAQPSHALSAALRVEARGSAREQNPETVLHAEAEEEDDDGWASEPTLPPPVFAARGAEYRLPEAEPISEAEGFAESRPPDLGAESGSFAHGAESRTASLTESQEIVLPDPIPREELSSESGELSLSGSDPSSGSFELPDSPTEPRIATDDPALRRKAAEAAPLLPFDDVQDALEGSQPIAVATNRATVGPSSDLDRDPDAEFDALLSEATDPRGMPTIGGSSEFDTDELLRGLEGSDLTDDDVGLEELVEDDATHEADALMRSLYEDSGDATDILDRATLGAMENVAIGVEALGTARDQNVQSSLARPSAPFDAHAQNNVTHPDPDADLDASLDALMTPDELDSGELEIMLDDEPTLAPQATPLKSGSLKPPPPNSQTARPGLSNKAPPPPPPSLTPEKRPSGGLLGRLFTKREGE